MIAKGIKVYDASIQEEVKVRVHYIILVGADMPERRTLMCSSGHQGKSFCEYCTVFSVKATGMHCPRLPPRDAPDDIHRREAAFKDKGMHLFYENIIPKVLIHYCWVFFFAVPGARAVGEAVEDADVGAGADAGQENVDAGAGVGFGVSYIAIKSWTGG